MKVHRFIVREPLQVGHVRFTDSRLCHQMAAVLRLRVGEHIIICDGSGFEAVGEITQIGRGFVELQCSPLRAVVAEPHRRVTLYASVLKRDNFELLAQKAVEVGVCAIVPIIAARTIKSAISAKRLQTIMHEAAEQSGRAVVPQLEAPQMLSDGFDTADATTFFCDVSGIRQTGTVEKTAPISVFIGPEGGWEPRELARARERGFHLISYGDLTMRAETAAIIAVHWAVHV